MLFLAVKIKKNSTTRLPVAHWLLLYGKHRVTVRHVDGGVHFILDKQRQVIRRNLWVWTADDAVFLKPLSVKQSQQSQRLHHISAVEHIVDDTFKVRPATHIQVSDCVAS